MIPKVVDASALAALCFGEPEGPAIAACFVGAQLFSTALLDFEFANVAWKKLRRDPGQRDALLMGLQLRNRFTITLHPVAPAELVEVAIAAGLTAYDASYLCLARRLNAELVTLDKRLAQAARMIV